MAALSNEFTRKFYLNPWRVLLGLFLASLSIYGLFTWMQLPDHLPVLDLPLHRATEEERIKIEFDVAVVILTSSPTINLRLRNLMDSWVPHWPNNTYWFSDNDVKSVSQFPNEWSPNWILTRCDKSYTSGLICKNKKMIQFFQEPHNRHYKWVLRLMDDTYVHMENYHHLVSQLDSSRPIIIGEKYCHPSFSYPTGGPGFILSRGFIDNFNFGSWKSITSNRNKEGIYDDLVWGQQVREMKAEFIHHSGFSQLAAGPTNNMFQYIASRSSWDLPFRPIAYHQGPNRFEYMGPLDNILHRVPYHIPDKKLVTAPECQCWPMSQEDHEIRCTASEALKPRKKCGDGLKNIKCLTG